MAERIYIIGHKAPDLDSVAAAISYAAYKNQMEGTDKYQPAAAGELNAETKYALEKFGFAQPEILIDASGQNLILVDHNETAQMAENAASAKIVEVIDHHKIDFKSSEPIFFLSRPWGASCTVIADLFMTANIAIDYKLAGLMLSAILVDTVITKSPTCTSKDQETIETLATLAGIEDWQAYGMELFKIRSNVAQLSAEEIIKSDFKDFDFKAGKFGIGQVETVDPAEFQDKKEEILARLAEMKEAGAYHTVILFITDIMKEGSEFLAVSADLPAVGKALGAEFAEGRVYIDGILSRKKQVAPKLTEAFDNN